jgi:cytochrome c oxidase subunit IV
MIMVKLYGEIFLLGVLACIGILLVYRQLRSGNRDDAGRTPMWSRDGSEGEPGEEPSGSENAFRLVFIGVLFVLSTLAYFAFYAGAPGAESLSATRIVVYVEVAAIPLVGFALWEFASRRGRLAWGLVSLIIIAAAVLNVAGHHNAPYQLRPGDQVSDSDIQGMEWLLHEKDPTAYTFFIMGSPDRFAQAILGATVTSTRTDVKDISWLQFKDHFGYVATEGAIEPRTYTTVGEQYPVDIYANINKYDKVAYQSVWNSLDRFNDADFKVFEQDQTVNRIYSDGASDAYYITGHSQGTGS